MKSTAPILALIVLITVGFSVMSSLSDTSPGPLSAVHANVADLRGQQGCEACHGTDEQSLDQACGDCHEAISNQIAQFAGFHGHLPEDKRKDCGYCHIEHLHADTDIVGDRAFQKSGWKARKDYKHEKLAFGLEGRHAELVCRDCHESADAGILKKDQHRFLGESQECRTCHEDPHEGKAPDCAACHGQERPFAEVSLFEHDQRFPLTGSHAGLTCQQCHDDGDYSGYISSPKSTAKQLKPRSAGDPRPLRDCQACHESPHSQGFTTAVAKRIGKVPSQSCAACHAIADESLSRPALDKTLVFHGLSGFDLVKPHAEVACAACHQEPTTDWKLDLQAQYRPRFPGRKAKECAVCHGDPHEGQFVAKGQSQSDCLSCHKPQRFLPHGFDLARHGESSFPLHGAHERLACEKCHEERPGRVDPDRYAQIRQFKGTPKECKECHESPHAGQFDGGFFEADDCLACHGDERFFPSRFTNEMHVKTEFPLLGAHRALACRDCHKATAGSNAVQSKISDRMFHGTEKACQSCHLDVHDGAFDLKGLPQTVEGKQACERCHGNDSFELKDSKSFQHGLWTTYKLTGAHAKAGCESCHLPGPPTHRGTRTMGKAKTGCSDCHENPHMGQFKVQGKTDCKRCHTEDLKWNTKNFSHETDARFKLGKDHSGLACSKCHQDYPLPGGGKVVRYKPLGTQCKDCHLWKERR